MLHPCRDGRHFSLTVSASVPASGGSDDGGFAQVAHGLHGRVMKFRFVLKPL
jgi:hypothetical protein